MYGLSLTFACSPLNSRPAFFEGLYTLCMIILRLTCYVLVKFPLAFFIWEEGL